MKTNAEKTQHKNPATKTAERTHKMKSEQIESQITRLQERHDAAQKEAVDTHAEIRKLETELACALETERVTDLIGNPVRIDGLAAANDGETNLLNSIGKLISIHGRNCVVEFGEGLGNWKIPAKHIVGADEPRRLIIHGRYIDGDSDPSDVPF